MKTSDFDFHLPEELIAQVPAEPRGGSRLLAVNRENGELRDLSFTALEGFLRKGDLLVVNDSRVIPARLFGKKETGGAVEILLLSRRPGATWEGLVRASKRVKPGSTILLGDGESKAHIREVLGEGRCVIEISGEEPSEKIIDKIGMMPLPPYIRRDGPRVEDREWYQTVYADPAKTGSAAAPTAGLHFTPELLKSLEEKGVSRVSVTLHVGLGTFLPVRVEDLEGHKMHGETYEVSKETAKAVNDALAEGRRVIAVGTTATRTLEWAGRSGSVEAGTGETSLFITPGYQFKVVGALLTNFHLPESTLLMLVSAFGGYEKVMNSYRHAVKEGYRFYSYGDAMFLY